NGPAAANGNIFGLPFTEEEAQVILLPVPWEVTVSYGTGTARAAEHILRASQQIDLYDYDVPAGWKKGFFMKPVNKEILMRSDYLRKEAELYIHFQIEEGNKLEINEFMQNGLHEVNKGSEELNAWVYQQTKELLEKNKLVGLIGGDHSSPLGYFKAIGEKYGDFGILHIDAHLDLRKSYEDFTYSHASIMYNALSEIPKVNKLVTVGARDYCEEELQMVKSEGERVSVFFDHYLKEQQYEGTSWQSICEEIIEQLPEKVYLSLDIDGLDPKLCPHTGTPVPGGLEIGQLFYLVNKVINSGRQLIGFDLVETGYAQDEFDANVSARVLFKLCNLIVKYAMENDKQKAEGKYKVKNN
ncbi:MAG: agmatinase family protein, partial [Chitinophagaceae bacterium]